MSKPFLILLCAAIFGSCKVYSDAAKYRAADTVEFECSTQYNKLSYTEKMNKCIDSQACSTGCFSIKLPKGLVYWSSHKNSFYFEFKSRQVICIRSACTNEETKFYNWHITGLKKGAELAYIEHYWTGERGYNADYFNKLRKKRAVLLCTNGRYNILLCNIKPKNFSQFYKFAETFKTGG